MQEGKEQQDFLREGMATAKRLQKQIEKWELQSLLGGEYDEGGALLSIQVALPTQIDRYWVLTLRCKFRPVSLEPADQLAHQE